MSQPPRVSVVLPAFNCEDTIEEVFEPHLLRSGFLQKTSRGRLVTELGCRAIGVEPSSEEQPGLFE